jgi:serine/threonine protein kinase
VAGKDIHDRWIDDVGRGDSIYESVFSYALYLSPLWMHADPMCDPLLDRQAFGAVDATETATAYAAFKKFLAFNGRGIPRRILRKFNERVRLNSSRAQLILSRDDVRQFRFFADLYDVLVGSESTLLGELREHAWTGRSDRKRLGLYYLIDWILLRGVDEFTLGDAVAATKRLSHLIAPAEEAAPAIIDRLLDLLVQRRYLEKVSSTTPVGSAASDAPRYRLTHQRLVEMGSLDGVVEQEAQAVINESKQERFGGRYEVLSVLGRGGMSTVFLAKDRVLPRHVAIKEQLMGLEDPRARDRIKTEAQALSRLQHENIVRVYDVHAEAKQPYIVMEYVPGKRLADVIGTAGLGSEDYILNVARQIVRALQFVHDRGILWRDPKPANIMITPEGRVVLLDFGISHLLAGADREAGYVVVTPTHASPEQLRGEPLDARSDIYCIGVILYQMISGKLPFGSDVSPAAIARRGIERPKPLERNPAVSPRLADAVYRCLESDRDHRFQSAGELLAALPESDTPITRFVGAVEPLQDEWSSDVPDVATQLFRMAQSVPPPPALAPADPIESASLIDDSGTTHALTPPMVRVGRAPSAEITLHGSTVSRFHAELTWSRNGWTLSDLNSRYGTSLNGTPVTSPVLLRHEDIIGLGKDGPHLVFHAGALPAGVAESGAPRVRRGDLDEFVAELRALAATAPLERVFEFAIDRAIDVSRTERGFVMTVDDRGDLAIRSARARGAIPLPGEVFQTSHKLPRDVFATGEMRVVSDLLEDHAGDDVGTASLGIRQVLCLPLVVRRGAQPIGVLYLDSRERARVPSQSVRDALQILAVELAHAIQGLRNEALDQEQRQPAPEGRHGVQEPSLFGDVDRNGSYYEAVGRSLSSGRFSGDFVLCLDLNDRRVAFAIGDVAGSGTAATLKASFIGEFVIANAARLSKPSDLISALNRILIEQSDAGQYATVLYGVLDSTGRLVYCNSGHNAPLLVQGGEVQRLESHGLPVGLFGEAPYDDSELMLAPGALLVCFSDGLSEAVNATGEEFSEQRIIQLATAESYTTLVNFTGTIFQQLSDFTMASPLRDDATVLAVRFTAGQ